MEIIYKSTENKSNFAYCSEIFKGRKTLNGFNKLEETMLFESIADKDYNCQNVYFDKEIIADLILCYPFSVVVKAEIKFKSLHELIDEIRKTYHKIYAEEAKTMRESKKSNSYNRASTDESFGIWGHSIYDLMISSIKIVEGDSKPLIDISVES